MERFDGWVRLQYTGNDIALKANPLAMDDTHLTQALSRRFPEILLDHPRYVARRDGVKIKCIRDRNRDSFGLVCFDATCLDLTCCSLVRCDLICFDPAGVGASRPKRSVFLWVS